MLRAALVTILVISSQAYAYADGAIASLITKADQGRLDKYEDTKAKAVAEAIKSPIAADVKQLNDILAKPELAFRPPFNLVGDWKCRTSKLGNEPPLVIYGWFKCRVTDDGAGWMLQKINGSQRTQGRFYTDSDKRLTYLGVGYVAGEKPKPYGASPENDQAGYAYRTSSSEFRIEFPAPQYESLMDILELKR